MKTKLEKYIENEADKNSVEIHGPEPEYEPDRYYSNISFKRGAHLLLPMLLDCVEQLEEIKCHGHSDLCISMKTIRPNYLCAYELADETLAKINKQIEGLNGT